MLTLGFCCWCGGPCRVLAGAGTGEADDSCFLLPLDPASGAPKGCPFPVKLTGEVPASIGKLTALSVLCVPAVALCPIPRCRSPMLLGCPDAPHLTTAGT